METLVKILSSPLVNHGLIILFLILASISFIKEAKSLKMFDFQRLEYFFSDVFYEGNGALQCLNEKGEVALIDVKDLNQNTLNLNLNDFRIICKNGSHAAEPGISVDHNCFMNTFVPGEIVMRKDSDKIADVRNMLFSLHKYSLNVIDFKLNSSFDGKENLLFKDSLTHFVSPNDIKLTPSVQNYISLFEESKPQPNSSIETEDQRLISSTGAKPTDVNIIWISVSALVVSLFSRK